MKVKSLVALSAVAAIAVISGCSSSAKSSSTTTTGKQAVCAARANLQQSLTALANPSLLTGGKSAIQSAVDTVKTNLDGVSSSAQQVYKPQVDAVTSALNGLETALSKLGNGNLTQNMQAVGNAIASVGNTAANLVTTLQTACP
jgi:hypothetical protein